MKNVTPNIQASHAVSKPKLLDQLKRCIRDKCYSLRTEEAYVYWARWFIRFHGLRHPAEMGAAEVRAFLSYLCNERHVAAATHKQALCALLFLYKQVLQVDLPWMDELPRPTRPPRRPTVLTANEVASVFAHMQGVHALMVKQELLGHADVSTTMIYTKVLNRGGRGVVSPIDCVGSITLTQTSASHHGR